MARSDVENTAAIAGVLGLGVQFGLILPHSRSHELHAGELGVDYMVKAGCDPQHAVRFWERINGQGGGQCPPGVCVDAS